MRDAARRLDRETEMFRRRRRPGLEHRGLGHPVERVVDLDRGEPPGVPAQHFLGLDLLRIEVALPFLERIAACAGQKSRRCHLVPSALDSSPRIGYYSAERVRPTSAVDWIRLSRSRSRLPRCAMTDKLIVSNKGALRRKYGGAGLARIRAALEAPCRGRPQARARDARRSTSTTRHAMRALRAPVVADPVDYAATKAAVDAVFRARDARLPDAAGRAGCRRAPAAAQSALRSAR